MWYLIIGFIGFIGSIASIVALYAWHSDKLSKDEKYKQTFRRIFIEETYWSSTKKLQDGEIAPFIFLSIEVIRERDYFKKPLTGSKRRTHDQQLSKFQTWIEGYIPHFKTEHKWYWIGHQGLYGFLNKKNYKDDSKINITQKVVKIGEDILKALPQSSFSDFGFRIIIHSSIDDIQFRKNKDMRFGVALDFLYDISIPSDDVNLYLTQKVFDEIGKKQKNDFVTCQFKVLQADLFSHKLSTINSLQFKMKKHLDNEEIIYAADFASQLYRLDDNNKSHLSDILLKLETVKTKIFPVKTLRFLYKSIQDETSSSTLKPKQEQILKEYKIIEKAITYCISKLGNGWHFEYVLLSGKSPNNFLINSPLVDKVINEKGISVHNECCLCSAKFGMTNFLINEKAKATNVLNWLKKQKKMEYRSQDSQLRDWRYTATVLRFAVMMEEEEYCHELFKLIINAKNWLENSEHNSIRMRGTIIEQLCNYFEKYSFSILDSNIKYKQKLIREITHLYKDIERYKFSPLALIGLKGLVKVLKIELHDELNMNIDFKDLIEKHIEYMINNSIWNEENGSWGFENVKTFPMIGLWFEYWQYKLTS